MAIVPTVTFAMTDAEYLTLNGVAAPNVAGIVALAGLGVTAASSAGTTTLTLNVGSRYARNIDRLAMLLTRLAYTYKITYTP